MQSYYSLSANPGDYLITSQIHILATKLQTYFQMLVKIFNNDISNLIFQFFVLKLVNGIPFNTILSQLKIIFVGIYLRYIKRYFRKYSPRKLIFQIQNTTGCYTGLNYDLTAKWHMKSTQSALIWKINKNTKHINELTHTDLVYVTGIKNDIATEIFVPSNIFWFIPDDNPDVFIDVYDDKLGMPPNNNAMAMSGTAAHKYIVVKSNVLSIDDLKKYVDNVVVEYNDFFANKFLQNQRIFIRSNNELISGQSPQHTPPGYNKGMDMGAMGSMMGHSYAAQSNPQKSNMTAKWRIEDFSTNKTWNTFFIENKKRIRENMEGLFSTSSAEDKRVGRVTKKIILAHGPSRCGKNSLFKILTSQLKTKHLIYIQPGSICNFEEFEQITTTSKICDITIPPEKRIYQLDEIDKSIPDLTIVDTNEIRRNVIKQLGKIRNINDTAIEERVRETIEMETHRRELELSKWLTYLDGAHEDTHKIIFMTAEYVDKLHPSLLKRCRLIEVKKANKNVVKKIVTMYFQYDGLDSEINNLTDKITDYAHTHSDVYDACENNVTNFDKKINNYEMIRNALQSLCDTQSFETTRENVGDNDSNDHVHTHSDVYDACENVGDNDSNDHVHTHSEVCDNNTTNIDEKINNHEMIKNTLHIPCNEQSVEPTRDTV